MKLVAAAIATLTLSVFHAFGADRDERSSTWVDFELVLKNPGTVDDQMLKPHKATAIARKRIQVPDRSKNPCWDFELTLWKHGIPGITIVTKKMFKERGRTVNGTLTLSYLEIDAVTYGQYLASQGLLPGDFLRITPKGARHRFPNIEEDTIDDRGTGVLAQNLWEYGDVPLAFARMGFSQGRLEKASFVLFFVHEFKRLSMHGCFQPPFIPLGTDWRSSAGWLRWSVDRAGLGRGRFGVLRLRRCWCRAQRARG